MSLTQAPSPVRPKVLVARRIFPEGLARLEEHCEIDYNDQIHPLSNAELANRLADKQGALVTGSEQVGTQALSQASQLQIISNIAVGFNNFDVAALNAKHVFGTNTPDVLTDTTADMAFALLMAMVSSNFLPISSMPERSMFDLRRVSANTKYRK